MDAAAGAIYRRCSRIMGVYIKGINYAECNKCPLNLMAILETCSLNKKKCPLVEITEPHGRLVDFEEIEVLTYIDADGEHIETSAPTVIESEE